MSLRIERDKRYKTRDGKVVRVICVDADGHYPVVVCTTGGHVSKRHADGRAAYGRETHPYDLISEYREPAECWLIRTMNGNLLGWFGSEAAAFEFRDQARVTGTPIEMREVLDD